MNNNLDLEKKKNEFTMFVLQKLNQNYGADKIEACIRVINNIDKFYGDYDSCFSILNDIIDSKNDYVALLSSDFVIKFLTLYNEIDLDNCMRSSLNTRIKEGVSCIAKIDTWYQADLADEIINWNNKRNLGEMCLYLSYISRLEDAEQANSLSKIIGNDRISSNKLDTFAAHLTWNSNAEDLAELNDFLEFSDIMSDEEFTNNLVKLSNKRSKARVRA